MGHNWCLFLLVHSILYDCLPRGGGLAVSSEDWFWRATLPLSQRQGQPARSGNAASPRCSPLLALTSLFLWLAPLSLTRAISPPPPTNSSHTHTHTRSYSSAQQPLSATWTRMPFEPKPATISVNWKLSGFSVVPHTTYDTSKLSWDDSILKCSFGKKYNCYVLPFFYLLTISYLEH